MVILGIKGNCISPKFKVSGYVKTVLEDDMGASNFSKLDTDDSYAFIGTVGQKNCHEMINKMGKSTVSNMKLNG
jgi:hypothetical protein